MSDLEAPSPFNRFYHRDEAMVGTSLDRTGRGLVSGRGVDGSRDGPREGVVFRTGKGRPRGACQGVCPLMDSRRSVRTSGETEWDGSEWPGPAGYRAQGYRVHGRSPTDLFRLDPQCRRDPSPGEGGVAQWFPGHTSRGPC